MSGYQDDEINAVASSEDNIIEVALPKQPPREWKVELPSDELEMRETEVPTPHTMDELVEYITALRDMPHDYGTCVYAMSMSAVAAFNYIAHTQGCTGFQASCADLDVIRRTRRLSGPFAIINGGDMLYPQYNIQANVADHVSNWTPWAAKEAQKLIDEHASDNNVAVNVMNHWKYLASLASDDDDDDV